MFYKHYLIHSQQPSKVGNNIISNLQMKNLRETKELGQGHSTNESGLLNSSLPDFKAQFTTKAMACKKIICGPFEKVRLTNQNFQGRAGT